jgi:hypothetical protein
MRKINWKSVLFGVLVGAMLFASAPVIADIGEPLLQGQGNLTHARTTLRGVAPGANLRIIQQKPDTEALSIFTEPGVAPMKVNRKAKVKNLNADLLDGRHGAYYAPAVPKAGTVIEGTFAAAGGDGEWLLTAVTFSPQLPYAIPQSNVHYLDHPITPTAECPGVGQAAEGHLCIYATWNYAATFNAIGGVEGSVNQVGAASHGFAVYWIGTAAQANVRGSWAHTVASSAPAAAPVSSASGYPAEIGE